MKNKNMGINTLNNLSVLEKVQNSAVLVENKKDRKNGTVHPKRQAVHFYLPGSLHGSITSAIQEGRWHSTISQFLIDAVSEKIQKEGL